MTIKCICVGGGGRGVLGIGVGNLNAQMHPFGTNITVDAVQLIVSAYFFLLRYNFVWAVPLYDSI